MAVLAASLPKRQLSVLVDGEDFGVIEPITKEEMDKIRDAAGNCPACIMAVLRQNHVPVPCAHDFDFKKEMESIWNEFWDEQNKLEQEPYY